MTLPSAATVFTYIADAFSGELGRIAATILIICAAVMAHRLNLKYLSKAGAQNQTPERSRQRVVALKNIVFFVSVMAVGTIWATKIAGVALSLAAFAGALVLSAKELIMCVTGYLFFSVSRPYRVGDYVEINGWAGRVTDVDMFATTLAEAATGNQLTGRAVSFPNSALLTHPVRNQSSTGNFVINLLRLAVPYNADRDKYENAALLAGQLVCGPWLDEADRHFRRIEEEDFLDLPSSKVKVIWEPHDIKQHWLTIRFASPLSQRVNAQQEIQRLFWREIGDLPPPAAA